MKHGHQHEVKILLDTEEYEYLKSHHNMSEKIRTLLNREMFNNKAIQDQLIVLKKEKEEQEAIKEQADTKLRKVNEKITRLQKQLHKLEEPQPQPPEYNESKQILLNTKKNAGKITKKDINFQAERLGVNMKSLTKWLEEDEVI